MYVYSAGVPYNNAPGGYREYIEAPLLTPLTAGITYWATEKPPRFPGAAMLSFANLFYCAWRGRISQYSGLIPLRFSSAKWTR
jgi:hypothetical protein